MIHSGPKEAERERGKKTRTKRVTEEKRNRKARETDKQRRRDAMSVDSQADVAVDACQLREEVKSKYREVALDPHGKHHFHTGRSLAKRLGYDDGFVGSLPDAGVEAFAGGGGPFAR